MERRSLDHHQYDVLPTTTAFRVAEVLPGNADDSVEVVLHVVDWAQLLEYEAVSYAWGNPNLKAPIHCLGRKVEVTQNLRSAMAHLRLKDRSRFLWADALCINQSDIPERSYQVRQMRRIYESTMTVLIWIGPDTPDHKAETSIDSIITISEFVSAKLGISISDPDSYDGTFQELILSKRESLPLSGEWRFGSDKIWSALKWFYSHPYFTRVWAIQEISASKTRIVHCGNRTVEWERVDLVASYLTMDTGFARKVGFTDTYCWWVATLTEMVGQPKNWVFMLYLASNFFCTDHKDYVYGLRGLMEFSDGGDLLLPDYSKSVEEVYRDSVEAALTNFRKTDVLLYVNGQESPSWVPRWDKPMLFRNPFRFGKPLPFKPAGKTHAEWKVDRDSNLLFLKGHVLDTVNSCIPYNESYFGKETAKSSEGVQKVQHFWQAVLKAMSNSEGQTPISTKLLTSAAVSFSFGLDENSSPSLDKVLLRNFIAYLGSILDEHTYSKYIPAELSSTYNIGNGDAFGQPVWDFEYPESGFLVTKCGVLGCAATKIEQGDVVFIALGSTYPFILRPDDGGFLLKGFCFVHGYMLGEVDLGATEFVKIK